MKSYVVLTVKKNPDDIIINCDVNDMKVEIDHLQFANRIFNFL